MATLSAAASLLLSSFETVSREDGSSFLRLSSSAPSWGSSAVMDAHCGEFPNDSRYQLIRNALSALSDGEYQDSEDASEALYEMSLDLVPCHTAELLQWFAACPSRLSDCDEALEQGRISEFSAFELLSEGYRVGAEETLSALISFLEDEREAIFNPDTDCRILLSDSHGIYIPQMYCSSLSEEDCEDLSIDWEDVQICQSGPDAELYWEAWQSILDAAEWEEEKEMWRLVQNGNLFAVRANAEIPEDWCL